MILLRQLRRFRRDSRGNIALMTALLAVPLIGALGLGVDYSMAARARQTTDTAARAAALQAIGVARTVIGQQAGTASNGDDDNTTTSAISAGQTAGLQDLAALSANTPNATLAKSSVVLSRTGQTLTATVSYTDSVATTFSQIIGFKTMSVGGTVTETGSLMDQSGPGMIIQELFANTNVPSTYSSTSMNWGVFPNYNGWVTPTTCAGVEIGNQYAYDWVAPPVGSYMAELDGSCNYFMSKKAFLPIGNYELRYYYFSRIAEPNFDPAYLCSAKPSDLDAILTGFPNSDTNRVGVYLDPAYSDTPPWATNGTPLSWQNNNAIDGCVSSGQKWIERSVSITVTTPGYYWLTFQGEGAHDSLGPLIADIRLCTNTCPGTVQEDFPWQQNQQLFSDDFNQGVTIGPGYLNSQLGATGTGTGWTQLPNTWFGLPNETSVIYPGAAPQGGNVVSLFNASTTMYHTITRSFLLDPGYYQIAYQYAPALWFPAYGNTYCGAASADTNLAALSAIGTMSGSDIWTYNGAPYVQSFNATDFELSVFVDNSFNVTWPSRHTLNGSWPPMQDQFGGFAGWTDSNNPTNYNRLFTTTVEPNKVPLIGQTLVDNCGYAPGWTARTVSIKISKPGFYWLTFEGFGGAEQWTAGMVANVRLNALGGLSMTSAPANPVAIPAQAPTAGTPIYLTNLDIAAQ